MPGNLNLKKSWHPGLHKNQAAVRKKEQDAIEERKKIQEREQEIQRERERKKLQEMQDKQSGTKRAKVQEWIYNAGTTTQNVDDEYLLGKRKVELKDEPKKEGEEEETERVDNPVFTNDPMMLIEQKRREHAKRRSNKHDKHKRREDRRDRRDRKDRKDRKDRVHK